MVTNKINDVSDFYDVVVIGGGLGGMTCANVLAKTFGYKVLIVERNKQLGGFAAWFDRKLHRFEISLHAFPCQIKKQLEKYWSKEISKGIKKISSIRYINPQFNINTSLDIDDIKDKLINYFLIKEKHVNKFLEKLKNFNLFSDDKINIKNFFKNYFSNRNDVFQFLLEPFTYMGGFCFDDPAFIYGIVFIILLLKGLTLINTVHKN